MSVPLAHCYIAVTCSICLLVFPVGEKTMKRRIGPACLSFLSKRSTAPWEEALPASPIGGAEKTACLSFLSKDVCPLGEAACFSDRRGRKDRLLVFSI
mgnify:FL=1